MDNPSTEPSKPADPEIADSVTLKNIRELSHEPNQYPFKTLRSKTKAQQVTRTAGDMIFNGEPAYVGADGRIYTASPVFGVTEAVLIKLVNCWENGDYKNFFDVADSIYEKLSGHWIDISDAFPSREKTPVCLLRADMNMFRNSDPERFPPFEYHLCYSRPIEGEVLLSEARRMIDNWAIVVQDEGVPEHLKPIASLESARRSARKKFLSYAKKFYSIFGHASFYVPGTSIGLDCVVSIDKDATDVTVLVENARKTFIRATSSRYSAFEFRQDARKLRSETKYNPDWS